MPCMICGANDVQRILKFERSRLSYIPMNEDNVLYTLEGCDKCDVVHLVDPPPKGEDYYREQYRKDVPRTQEAVKKARAVDKAVVPLLLEVMCAPTFGYVLDLCAEDASVVSMFECQVDSWGLDSGPLMSIRENAYNLVTCFLSLEHVEEPIEFARAALRSLRPGGLFIASVPNVDKDLGLRPHHTWYYRGHSLMILLKSAGFQEQATVRYGGYIYACGERMVENSQ